MPDIRPPQVRCYVYTYKEGLLSAVAHDLKLELTDLELHVEDDRVEARAKADSLRVICAMSHGKERPSTLSDKDKREIIDNTNKDVLKVKKFPEIRFVSSLVERSDDRVVLRGDLEIVGVKRSVSWNVRRDGDQWEARLHLHQPDWNIKPFTAVFGTLKIQPDIDVVVRVDRAAVDG